MLTLSFLYTLLFWLILAEKQIVKVLHFGAMYRDQKVSMWR